MYMERCKLLIEERLDWTLASKDWKQRDFLNLIAALDDKTGISLSLSTIKRIWSDEYKGNPHPSTLNALAQFLDHEDWLSFQNSEKDKIHPKPAPTAIQSSPHRSSQTIFLLVSLFLLAILAVCYISVYVIEKEKNEDLIGSLEDVSFSSVNTEPIGVPNTVVFTFNLADVQADSFAIQQSWNPLNREKIAKTDSILTSIYYYPGVHQAKLIANDSVIKESPVMVYSDGWIATADHYGTSTVPMYIPLNLVDDKRSLHVTEELLSAQNIEIGENLHVSYFYVDTFPQVSGDNFSLSLDLQADSISNLTCPRIMLMVMGTKEMHVINLTETGCVHQAYAKLGEHTMDGKYHDLSSLGIDVYERQALRMEIKEKTCKLYVNHEQILETSYTESIGEMTGFCYTFTGTGQVHSMTLTNNSDGQLVYEYRPGETE